MTDVKIRMTAEDAASAKIENVKKSLAGFASQQGVLGGVVGGLVAGGMLGMANAAVQVAAQIPAAAAELANMAAQAERTEASFDALAGNVGQSSQEMLSAMRAMTSGTVADTDLMLAANRAMMLGVSDNAEEMSQLMAAAIERGRALGVSSQQAVNDVITGIGRMSPMILDNLGIVGVTQAVENYAKSLGKTSEALTDVERKQALVNAVIASGSGMSVKMDAASAAEQAQAAQQNAAVAVGGLMVGPVRDFNEGVTDMINILTGKFDEIGSMAREYQEAISNDMAGDNADGMQAYVDAANALGQAIQNNLPVAEYYSELLQEMSRGAGRSGDFGAAEIGKMRGITTDIARGLADMKAAKLDADAAMAETSSLHEYRNELTQAAKEARDNKAAAETAALGISGLARVAAAGAADVATLEGAVRSLNNAMLGMAPMISNMAGIRQAAIGKAESLALQAIEQGADPTEVTGMLANMTDSIWNLAPATDASTEAQFGFKLAVEAQLDPLQSLNDKLNEANTASQRLASQGLKDTTKAFDDLKSKVSSMLQQGLSPDVSIPEGLVPREDDINENARRLAAIANEGLGDQSWMEEFKNEVPGIFDEIVSAADPKAAAARIFTEFQAGLRPELIDKDLVKERIKAMITGEREMGALAAEIAQELAAKMGVSLPEALSAAQSALGVTPTDTEGEAGGAGTGAVIKPTFDLTDVRSSGAAAGVEFAAGMDAPGAANKFSAAFMLGMKDFYGRFYASGVASSVEYNNGFLTQFKTSVPVEIVLTLAALVTPEVLAALAARGSRTGATP